MDVALTILWQKEHAGLVSGMIINCREIRSGIDATWTGTEYQIVDAIDKGSTFIVLFVTGVPVSDIRSLQYCLEENPTSDQSVKRKWLMDETLVTTAERDQVLALRYLTVTWERFKQLCVDLLDVHITDNDLLSGIYE